jgi:multiple sugar transport system permease protein
MSGMRLSPAEHRRLRRRARLRRELTGWAFLAPMFVFFLVFLVYPVIETFWWSTRSGGLLGTTQGVGLQNYTQFPQMVDATSAVKNTLNFALYSVPLTLVLALMLALLLARVSRGGAVYRFLIYFPVLVPGVVAGLIWLFLTNPDFGLLNNILRGVGAKPVVWLGSSTALPTLAAVDVWRNTGYWAIFFVAALIGLPQELYQAAALDGAGPLSRFWFLTLPMLRRILMFAIVVSTIWGLQVFDTALIMTAGGPGTATTTIVYRVWQYVFAYDDKIGLAAAMSAMLVVAILILTLVQLRMLRGQRGLE